jgi:hypothetical protein
VKQPPSPNSPLPLRATKSLGNSIADLPPHPLAASPIESEHTAVTVIELVVPPHCVDDAAARDSGAENTRQKPGHPPPDTFMARKGLDSGEPDAAELAPSLDEIVWTLGAPPDRILFARVFGNLSICLARAEHWGATARSLKKIAGSISDELGKTPRYEHSILIKNLRTAFPVWTTLSRLDLVGSEAVEELVSSELILAIAHKRVFRKAVAAKIKQVLDCNEAVRVEKETKLGLYAGSFKDEIRRLDVQRQSGIPASTLLTNSRIVAALLAEMKCKDRALREVAGQARILTIHEARAAALALRQQAETGDIEAIAVIHAFVLGLAWDTALDVPFARADLGSWVAIIDVASGWNRTDLRTVLPSLAKPIADHRPASKIVARPNPLFAAIALQKACATAPGATCMRDLIEQPRSSREDVPGIESRGTKKISVSRFIASRGMLSVAAEVDRTVGAYSVGAYALIGKARHHYVTIHPAEIWDGSCKLFASLGWGEPAEGDLTVPLGIGSSVTPTSALIRRIDQHWLGQVEGSRVGRRYCLLPLLAFSNNYSKFCCNRAAFFTVARAAEKYAFRADQWRPGAGAFGVLVDKRVGPYDGATPLPISIGFHLQIKLWLAHLVALDQRLEKLGVSPDSSARRHIKQVLNGEAVSLFFLISPDLTITVPGSRDLFSFLPEGIELKGDVYRHFVSDSMRALGVPTPYVDALDRHIVEGLSVYRLGSAVSTMQWLSACSSAIDQLAVQVGFRPVAGISRRR